MSLYLLTWLAALSCLAAASYACLGLRARPGNAVRHAGRVLVCVGHALLGARLAYLLVIGDLVRLHPLALIGITMVSLGTAAIWVDICEEQRE